MGGGSSRKKTEPRVDNANIDSDEKSSCQEREKNWICVKKGGETMTIYGRDGMEGVLKFDDLEDIQSVTPAFRRL